MHAETGPATQRPSPAEQQQLAQTAVCAALEEAKTEESLDEEPALAGELREGTTAQPVAHGRFGTVASIPRAHARSPPV